MSESKNSQTENLDLFELDLNEAQMGIWSGQKLNPQSALYNAAEAIEIEGDFNEKTFEQALEQTLNEASALNYLFKDTQTGPKQFNSEINFSLIKKDFSLHDAAYEEANKWMHLTLSQVVDIEKEPVYKQALLKVSDTQYIWYQQIHHIVCDGYAFALLSQRTAELYNELIGIDKKKTRSLDNFHKVIEEDQHYQNSTLYSKNKEFWLKNLENSNTPCTLTDSDAPINNQAIRVSCEISPEKLSLIKSQSLDNNCSWSDYLLAVVAYLIYQHNAKHEIILGLPVMGRMGSVSLRVPAMIMNIIPLKINIKKNSTFKDLITSVTEELTQTRPHQKYRYENIRRDLKMVGGNKKLFGPVINIMPFDRNINFTNTESNIKNISAGPVEDISFNFITQNNGGLRFDLDANPDRYKPDEIYNIQKETVELIDNLSININNLLGVNSDKLSWISARPISTPITSALSLINNQVKSQPDKTAIIDGDNKLSYQQLFEKSKLIAACIKSLDITPGKIIVLSLPRGSQAIIGQIATLITENVYLFIDPEGPDARNKLILEDANPDLVIYDKINPLPENGKTKSISYKNLELINNKIPITDIDSGIENSFKSTPDSLSKLAYLIYTSGSTGKPKGVMINQKSLAEFIISSTEAYNINGTERILQFAPLHFDTCVEEIFLALCNGGTLIIRNNKMLESTSLFLETCDKWNITLLDLPTAYWHELVFYCVNTEQYLPASINTVIIGGEAAQAERLSQWHTINRHNADLLNTYGPSEATVVATFSKLYSTSELSIGQPLPGRKIAVTDKHGQLLRKGEAGELLLLGAGLGNGYLNCSTNDIEKFQHQYFTIDNKIHRAYHTGDRVCINSQGNIEYLGRLDDEIKISGQRINPLEIESVLSCIENIEEAAVVLHNSSGSEKHLAAFIKSTTEYNIQQLRKILSKSLPMAMLPATLTIMKELPKNQAGKIDRVTLSNLRPTAITSDTSASPEESIIISTWKQVLGQNKISTTDDFFLLGGQSLQTIQVANRLSAHFKFDVPVTLLFQHPVVSELAAAILDKQHVSSLESDSSTNLNLKKQDDLLQQIYEDSHVESSWLPAIDADNLIKPINHILLSGSTGFVGIQLLYQLLAHTEAQITCLIRASDNTAAITRLTSALSTQGLNYNIYTDRIEVCLADLEQENLGLSDKKFKQLSEQTDVVWHNAANTSVMRNYQSLRAANVLATKSLLKLCAKRQLPLNFISTISVAPQTAICDVFKEEYINWHNGLFDGYQQSKWAAENLLRQASERGYHINTYRLARVSGNSKNGFLNHKDLIWNIIRASIRNKAYPQLDIHEPWTPVDTVTDAIVRISLNHKPDVYNVTPESKVSLLKIFSWLKNYGFYLQPLPLNIWIKKLDQSGHAEDEALLNFFKQREQSDSKIEIADISNEKFKKTTKDLNISLPEVTQTVFNKYIDFAIKNNFIDFPETTDHSAKKITTNKEEIIL